MTIFNGAMNVKIELLFDRETRFWTLFLQPQFSGFQWPHAVLSI